VPAAASRTACSARPGTGKTVTVVECALQVLRAQPAAVLLLCAPTPFAADILCSRLAAAGVGPGAMVRLNDPGGWGPP